MNNLKEIAKIMLLALLAINTSLILTCLLQEPKEEEVQEPTEDYSDDVLTIIHELNIQHPDIVHAQVILESGHLTSNNTKMKNNITGMRVACQRPTTSLNKRGYAAYRSVRDCLVDYALWQAVYARNLTETQYYEVLEKSYASDKNYINKLKKIRK